MIDKDGGTSSSYIKVEPIDILNSQVKTSVPDKIEFNQLMIDSLSTDPVISNIASEIVALEAQVMVLDTTLNSKLKIEVIPEVIASKGSDYLSNPGLGIDHRRATPVYTPEELTALSNASELANVSESNLRMINAEKDAHLRSLDGTYKIDEFSNLVKMTEAEIRASKEPTLVPPDKPPNDTTETDNVGLTSKINYGDTSGVELSDSKNSEVPNAAPKVGSSIPINEKYTIPTYEVVTKDGFVNPLLVSAQGLSDSMFDYTQSSVTAEVSELEKLIKNQDYSFNYHPISNVFDPSQWRQAGEEWGTRVNQNVTDIRSNIETMGEDVLKRLEYMKSADFLVKALNPEEILRSWTENLEASKFMKGKLGHDIADIILNPEKFVADMLAKANKWLMDEIDIAQKWVSDQFENLKKKEILQKDEVRTVTMRVVPQTHPRREEKRLFNGRSSLASFEFHDEAYWDINIEPYKDNAVPKITDYFPEGWVPILNYNLQLDSISTTDMDLITGTNIPIPNATLRSPKLSLQLVESSELGLYKFKKDFKNFVIPRDSGGVRGYEDSCYKITITRFRPDWSLLGTDTVYGVPEITLSHQGTSEPSPDYQDLVFNIVGEEGKTYSGESVINNPEAKNSYTGLPAKVYLAEEIKG